MGKRVTCFLFPFVFGIVVGVATVIVVGHSLPQTSICSAAENNISTRKPFTDPPKPKKQRIQNSTRTIIFDESGKVKELHKCSSKQSIIPDIPMDSTMGSVGIYNCEGNEVLVCGGLQKTPKLCFEHKLDSEGWQKFPYELNTNRLQSYIKLNGNKIFIIGGRSSDVNQECYPSQEVLDLDTMSGGLCAGWEEE